MIKFSNAPFIYWYFLKLCEFHLFRISFIFLTNHEILLYLNCCGMIKPFNLPYVYLSFLKIMQIPFIFVANHVYVFFFLFLITKWLKYLRLHEKFNIFYDAFQSCTYGHI